MSDLSEIEAQHGFVFGNPDGDKGAGAPAVAALVCNGARCPHRGRHVQIHADTVLPLHCGGCGAVLHCDHAPEQRTVRGGTLGAPVEHDITACTRCGSELARTTRDLDPAAVLLNLPHGILDLPL